MKNVFNRQDEFFDCFDIIIADPAQQISSFKLRHLVYCEELKWEQPKANGMETDKFDKNATHILIQHKRTKQYAGTVRFVLADHANELPHSKYFAGKIDSSFANPYYSSLSKSCEISRLTVSPFFKARADRSAEAFQFSPFNPRVEFTTAELRNFPKITISLYLACIALARRLSVESMYMATRPGLNKIIRRLGIHFSPVSEFAEIHGKRKVHHAFCDEHLANFTGGMQSLYNDVEGTINMQHSWDYYQHAI
jgi:N-acyl amino acid synthase of PEP-CTERM/exosortase system